MLLLFDMKGRDTHNVVMLQRQLHSVMEIDRACGCRSRLLCLYQNPSHEQSGYYDCLQKLHEVFL
jgi:hypothetical protein